MEPWLCGDSCETSIKNPRYTISNCFLLFNKSRKASSSTSWGQHLDSGSSIFSIAKPLKATGLTSTPWGQHPDSGSSIFFITKPLKATVSRAHLHIIWESVVCVARLEMPTFWVVYMCLPDPSHKSINSVRNSQSWIPSWILQTIPKWQLDMIY